MSVADLAAQERRDLASFLETLSAEQWEADSLCDGWRVRDVVAHVISYEGRGPAALGSLLLRGRLLLGRINDAAVRELSSRSTAELVDLVRRHAEPSGLTAAFGGRIALVDGLMHHQDIRRPLGMPRQVPPERLRVALPFALIAPPIRGFWNVRGVRVVATDLDWSAGRGPEARGSGEAVLMAVGGRRGAARELSGPGAAVLQERLG